MLVGPYLSHPLTRNMKNAHRNARAAVSCRFSGYSQQQPKLSEKTFGAVKAASNSTQFLQSGGALWENTYRVELPKVKIWQVVHQRAIYRHTNELDFMYEVVVKAFLIFWWTVTL